MKLVIDLPDEVVKWFKEKGFIPIGQYLTVDEAMKKAEPLSDVLNGIKAEIKELSFDVTERSSGEQMELNYTANVLKVLDNIGKAESEDKG